MGLCGVQNHYSIISREWEKNGLLSWCKENDISFWAWAVLEEGMLYALIAGTAVSLAELLLFGVFGVGVKGGFRIALGVIFAIALLVCGKSTQWCVCAYNACAKRNPQGRMIGVDRWGKEYASFSLPLCQDNAKAEGVTNAEFQRGDAAKLDFPDETFDAVTSNYVYHNISGADKQELLLETLRVLKKGGTFAIHDLMSPRRYGDIQAFVKKLKGMGYERVELIDTTDGKFMSKSEAKRLMLTGSALLVGKK